MPSKLFIEALAALSSGDAKAFLAFGAWLGSMAGGPRLVGNLQRESHLVGDEGFGVPRECASFLRRCATGHAKGKTDRQRCRSHAAACTAHQLRGLRIPRPHLPNGLLRYRASTRTAGELLERMLGPRARRFLKAGAMDTDEASRRLASAWDPSKLTKGDTLGRAGCVFATFDHPGGAPRGDALDMAQALALPAASSPVSVDEAMVEFSYPTDSVRNHRFPTVADAGDHPLFEPAKEIPPNPGAPETCTGWTRPIGKHSPQPEIVHRNNSLRVLDRAPRLVGRIQK